MRNDSPTPTGRRTPPLVTVGVPIYNDAQFAQAALDDWAQQSLTDIEVIISDNASTDATPEICRAFVEKYPFARYVRQEKNLGHLANFLFLLGEAQGKYFVWGASDDRHDPAFLAFLAAELEASPTAASAFCSFSNIDDDDRELETFDFDFRGSNAFMRVSKFLLERRRRKDVMFYGLHRTEVLRKARFYKWPWPNRNVVIRVAYPVVTYLLAKGYVHVAKPLFRSRMDPTRIRDHYLKNRADAGVTKLVKVNLLEFASLGAILNSVFRATRSSITVLALIPVCLLSYFVIMTYENARNSVAIARALTFPSIYPRS